MKVPTLSEAAYITSAHPEFTPQSRVTCKTLVECESNLHSKPSVLLISKSVSIEAKTLSKF